MGELAHDVGAGLADAHTAADLPGKVLSTVPRMAIDVAAVVPYAIYYADYERAIPAERRFARRAGSAGFLVRALAGTALTGVEGVMLAEDAAIDVYKGESIGDEGKTRPINPLHSFPFIPRAIRELGGSRYLPGIHSDGKIDWRWG